MLLHPEDYQQPTIAYCITQQLIDECTDRLAYFNSDKFKGLREAFPYSPIAEHYVDFDHWVECEIEKVNDYIADHKRVQEELKFVLN